MSSDRVIYAGRCFPRHSFIPRLLEAHENVKSLIGMHEKGCFRKRIHIFFFGWYKIQVLLKFVNFVVQSNLIFFDSS